MEDTLSHRRRKRFLLHVRSVKVLARLRMPTHTQIMEFSQTGHLAVLDRCACTFKVGLIGVHSEKHINFGTLVPIEPNAPD